VGAALALVIGLGPRLLLTSPMVGDRSAAVLTVLLTLGAWLAAWLLLSPRAGFVAAVAAVAAFDVASLDPRAEPSYDDRQALYRTDQVLDLAAVAPDSLAQPVLVLLVEPVLRGPQSPFGLAAEIQGAQQSWRCPFQPGLQRIGLPLGSTTSRGPLHLRLHLTGEPDRGGDYLVVYSSARQTAAPLVDLRAIPPGTTLCSPETF
jgi:hypothetical protein